MKSVKNQLIDLEEAKQKYLERHNKKIAKIKAKCKHSFSYHEEDWGDYDRTVDKYYQCDKCSKKLSKFEYEKGE